MDVFGQLTGVLTGLTGADGGPAAITVTVDPARVSATAARPPAATAAATPATAAAARPATPPSVTATPATPPTAVATAPHRPAVPAG